MPYEHRIATPLTVLSVSSPCPTAVPPPLEAPPPAAPAPSHQRYSIRLAEKPGTPCAACLEPTGTGPVGFLGEEPICDVCLLRDSPMLGMVLALVAVTRDYGAFEPSSSGQWQAAMAQLGAFARIFERFAARFGPRRRILRPQEAGGNTH